MDQPTKKEAVEPNPQEFEEQIQVNYLITNENLLKKIITRC
jgi:hypothetical protein